MKELNRDIWRNSKKLNGEVEEKLLKIADIFVDKIETPINIKNIFLTGSLATYQWNSLSDLDLHIIVDVLDEKCLDTVDDYFDTKSKNFNKERNIFLKGFKVEVNMKREEAKLEGKAIYDLINREWYVKPIQPTRNMNDHEVLTIVSRIQFEIDTAINNRSQDEVFKSIRKRIKKMRVDGLQSEGEYSVGNLAFKLLRNTGYIKKLFDSKRKFEDEQLSVESFKTFYIR
jgi:hypothetical protein